MVVVKIAKTREIGAADTWNGLNPGRVQGRKGATCDARHPQTRLALGCNMVKPLKPSLAL